MRLRVHAGIPQTPLRRTAASVALLLVLIVTVVLLVKWAS